MVIIGTLIIVGIVGLAFWSDVKKGPKVIERKGWGEWKFRE